MSVGEVSVEEGSVGEMSVGDLSGLGNVCPRYVSSAKCPSAMGLVGKGSIGNVSGRGNLCRESLRWGNVSLGCVRESFDLPYI